MVHPDNLCRKPVRFIWFVWWFGFYDAHLWCFDDELILTFLTIIWSWWSFDLHDFYQMTFRNINIYLHVDIYWCFGMSFDKNHEDQMIIKIKWSSKTSRSTHHQNIINERHKNRIIIQIKWNVRVFDKDCPDVPIIFTFCTNKRA